MRTPTSSTRVEHATSNYLHKDRVISNDSTLVRSRENLSPTYISSARDVALKKTINSTDSFNKVSRISISSASSLKRNVKDDKGKKEKHSKAQIENSKVKYNSQVPLRETINNSQNFKRGKVTQHKNEFSHSSTNSKEKGHLFHYLKRGTSAKICLSTSTQVALLPPTYKSLHEIKDSSEPGQFDTSIFDNISKRESYQERKREMPDDLILCSNYYNANRENKLSQRKESPECNGSIGSLDKNAYYGNHYAVLRKNMRSGSERVNHIHEPKCNDLKRKENINKDRKVNTYPANYTLSQPMSRLGEIFHNLNRQKDTQSSNESKRNCSASQNELSHMSPREKKEDSVSNKTTVMMNPLTQTKGLIGLNNIGNTCFMNSILQCLFNAPLFSEYFLRGNHQAERSLRSKGLADSFANLLKKVQSPTSLMSQSGESTHDIKGSIGRVNPIFSGFEQNDAQELLKTILEGINDDLSRVRTKPVYKELSIDPNKSIQDTSDEWFNYNLGRDNSIVTDLFCGQLLSKTRCTTCNNESLAFDNYWDLALCFLKRSSSKSHLLDMIGQFLKEEDLDDLFYCEKCKERRKSKKKIILWRLPKILVIQLKRFEYSKWKREKINESIVFPVNTLDLSQFVRESQDRSVREAKYTLFGVVNHSGSLSGGHYTAQCMNSYNKRWYNFNDSMVNEKPMNGKEVESSAPYILFYIKSSHSIN